MNLMPNNIKQINEKMKTLESQQSILSQTGIPTDSSNSWQSEIQGKVSTINPNDVTSIPLNQKPVADSVCGTANSLLQGSPDSYMQQARSIGVNAYNAIKQKMFQELDVFLEDKKNAALQTGVMSQYKGAADAALNAAGLGGRIDSQKLMTNVSTAVSEGDITSLTTALEKRYNTQVAILQDAQQVLMDQVNNKTISYGSITSLTSKMTDLASKVVTMDTCRQGVELYNMKDTMLDSIEGKTKDQILDLAVQKALNDAGVPQSSTDGLTVSDTMEIYALAKGKGIDIKNVDGSYDLNKLPNMVSAQTASKVAKAIRNQLPTTAQVEATPTYKTEINGNESLTKDINQADDLYKSI